MREGVGIEPLAAASGCLHAEGVRYNSQGQRPWIDKREIIKRCKREMIYVGRSTTSLLLFRAFSARRS